jgi:type II secretion system protein G
MRKNRNILNGFTLIELLVVIGIIGVLTGAVIIALNPGARIAQSRDGVRKSDLHQIQSALELYRSDKGRYPDPTTGEFPACGHQFDDNPTPPTLPVIYMRTVPCDSRNVAPYVYKYALDDNGYDLTACLETITDPQRDSSNNPTGSSSCDGTSNWSYTLHNP